MLFEIVLVLIIWFLLNKYSHGRTKSAACLVGKTAIVTGGNAGIGYQTCVNLASRGCRVIIADKDDSQKSRQAIIERTTNPNIVSKKLDLASFKSIREFVDDINSTEERLDILVNNAGVGTLPANMTEDGIDPVMQVNYFGPFLLTTLMTGLLKKSAPSRIVFTSSAAAYVSNLNMENFNSLKMYGSTMGRFLKYANSKLATIFATQGFAKKLKGQGVTCNALHPGVVDTGIFQKFAEAYPSSWWLVAAVHLFCGLFKKNIWEGAQVTTHLAISQKVSDTTGKFFLDCVRGPEPIQSWNKKLGEKIWSESEQYVRLLPSEKL